MTPGIPPTGGGTRDEAVPAADPAAIVLCGCARFAVLAPALLRLEWSPEGRFEDGASQVFVNRRTPVCAFEVQRDGESVSIRTSHLNLWYRGGGAPFAADTLRIELRRADPPSAWVPGLPDQGNLRGTTRTLDNVSGECPLDPGILSRDGWAVIDDSHTLVFDRYPDGWLRPRPVEGAVDLYFFGHGRGYAGALRDFVTVAGRIPLPPRWALGCWWSRYWPYTDEDLRRLAEEFRAHDVPLDVLCVDMDWHLDGWTGYTWNPVCFSDPGDFLRWARGEGLRVMLNLHPADGVGRHEERFAAIAAAMGLDPNTAHRVPFDCTDPRFMRAYFDLLHRPLEEQGVEFWWIDWQQGTHTPLRGLDPLWWLNHLHWTDMERNERRGGRRPLLLSRWGGLGGHRCPVQFSGDAFSDWPSLRFQPHFTATAANVGAAWWSHDIGGHLPGPVEGELYLRWIQFGAFSPVLRTHSGRHPDADRRIWAYGDRLFRAARDAIRLRYALIPYIYAAARRAHESGQALCRPMYHDWPDSEEAYRAPGQYMFGPDLLVAPALEPADAETGLAGVDVWLPPGPWTHLFTGERCTGPAHLRVRVPLEEIAVYVRGGAVIPMAPVTPRSDEQRGGPLALHVFPGGDGAASLYEDDGCTNAYRDGGYSYTPIVHARRGEARLVQFGPAEGGFPGMPAWRTVEILLRDTLPARRVAVGGRELSLAQEGEAAWNYDPKLLANVVRIGGHAAGERLEVEVELQHDGRAAGLLERGLRGCLARLEALAGALGGAAPPPLHEVGGLRASLASGPHDVVPRLAHLHRQWPALCEGIGAAAHRVAAAEQALTALVGGVEPE